MKTAESYLENYNANGSEFQSEKLLPCPCCGGEAKITFIGNAHTKDRKVEIKCTRCFLKRTDATINFSHEWVAGKAIEKWNDRTFAIEAIKADREDAAKTVKEKYEKILGDGSSAYFYHEELSAIFDETEHAMISRPLPTFKQ